jgi:hypothetical protein
MKRHLSLALVVCLAALGLTAGLFAFPAQADNTAGAHSLADLQALGYVLNHGTNGSTLCWTWVVADGNGAPWTVLGEPDQSTGDCATDPAVFQQRIDDLIAAYPPQPAATTAPAETSPAVAALPAAPATPAAPQTTTVTVTVTDPTVQAQLDALNAKIDALANPTVDARLSALEQRQQVNDARIATLELKAGIIVPEAKNEPPFTNPV